MKTRGRWVAAPVAVGVALAASAGCSSGGSSSSGASPLTLVSECDRICGQLATCGATAASLEAQCQNACGDLALVQAGCLDPFAGYLTCLADVTSVQCTAGGTYVVVTPPSCESARQSFLTCNAGPSPVAACVQLPPDSTTCPAAGSRPTFCVGQPATCTSPQPNPLGLGTFCCPSTS